MSKGINKVILLGNLGKDPDFRLTTTNAVPVVTFNLALNRNIKDGESWKQATEWVRCIAWERQAEIIAEYVRKGQKLYVEGKLQTREWTDKETNLKRYSTEVVVQDFSLLGPKPPTGEEEGEDSFARPTHPNQPEAEADNIPF